MFLLFLAFNRRLLFVRLGFLLNLLLLLRRAAGSRGFRVKF